MRTDAREVDRRKLRLLGPGPARASAVGGANRQRVVGFGAAMIKKHPGAIAQRIHIRVDLQKARRLKVALRTCGSKRGERGPGARAGVEIHGRFIPRGGDGRNLLLRQVGHCLRIIRRQPRDCFR